MAAPLSLRADMSARRSESTRTRSTTRPRRDEVDKIMLPQAEISTAGVIIAVKTAIAASVSIDSLYNQGDFQIESNPSTDYADAPTCDYGSQRTVKSRSASSSSHKSFSELSVTI